MDREEQLRILNRKIYFGLDTVLKIIDVKKKLKKLIQLERDSHPKTPSFTELDDKDSKNQNK